MISQLLRAYNQNPPRQLMRQPRQYCRTRFGTTCAHPVLTSLVHTTSLLIHPRAPGDGAARPVLISLAGQALQSAVARVMTPLSSGLSLLPATATATALMLN
ncbi:hypothetical protein J6590_033745 [Homalodisca vitripennis]|nr:hypothetical protein J6590_033745 [Homalodisca vitripennis]